MANVISLKGTIPQKEEGLLIFVAGIAVLGVVIIYVLRAIGNVAGGLLSGVSQAPGEILSGIGSGTGSGVGSIGQGIHDFFSNLFGSAE